MRDLLVIVGFSIVIPPNPSSPNPHFPNLKPSLTTTTTRLSHFKSPASTSSGQHRSPLLSTVRYDPSGFSASKSHLKYYADLASKLAEVRKFDDFLMIAETVVVSGAEPSGFVSLLSADLVSAGIVRLIREGKVWRAVEVLCSVHELGIDVIQVLDDSVTEALAIVCGRSLKIGNVEDVVTLMESLAGFSFPIKELARPSDIVRLCVRHRDPNTAIRYASALPRSHVVLCTIICEFGKRGDLASSLIVFEASKKKSKAPNMYAYRTIIDVCGLCGDYLKSRSIFEELLAEKIKPNIYVFNSLMNVNACDLSYIMHVYKQMQSLGVPADTTSYNILLKSCCLAARVDLAQEIYSEARRLELAGVLKLDVFTYSTIIKVFSDAKQWQTAIKIKEDMQSSGVTPNTVTWSSLISACANVGQVEQAIRLFDDMLLAGCEPNSQCCNVLLHACVEACQYDRAFRIFRSWKESGFHKVVCEAQDQNSYAKLGSSSAEADRSFELHHLNFRKKISFKPTTATYNILMKACGTDYRRAKALMDEMKDIGLSPNHISWSTLINVCGASGNVEGAMQILSSMREVGVQPDVIVYTTAIKVCVDRRNIKAAFSLFEEMRRYQIKPNLVTYNTLLKARTRYGSLQEVQQCLEVYQDMRKAGYNPNDYYLKQLIEEWCEGVIQNNHHHLHHHIFPSNELDSGGPHSLVLEKVAVHLQKQNAESLAIDLQGLTKVEARIVVLAVLRMIKENYAQRYPVRDDLLIILGVKKTGGAMAEDKSGVEEAIIKLLQNEIGLDVVSEGSKRMYLEVPSDPSTTLEDDKALTDLKSPTRRPAILHRLKVTRKSLYQWLQRRVHDRFN